MTCSVVPSTLAHRVASSLGLLLWLGVVPDGRQRLHQLGGARHAVHRRLPAGQVVRWPQLQLRCRQRYVSCGLLPVVPEVRIRR